MKNVLKYIIAVLLLGSIAAWIFCPVVNLVEDRTLLELMKIGFGYYRYIPYTGTGTLEGYMHIFFSPLSWWIAGFGILTLLELFFVVILKSKLSYIIAFVCSLLDCVATVCFFLAAENQLSQLEKKSAEFPGQWFHYTGQIYIEAIGIFLGIYTLVIILSLLGIWLWRRAERNAAEEYVEESGDLTDIYPEEFGYDGGYDAESGILGYDPVYPAGEEEIPVSEDIPSGGGFLNQYGGDTPEKRGHLEFHGAVLGENGRFRGKAYPLKYEEESFFVSDESAVSMSDGERDTAIAAVYYAEEYAEYCIRPLRRMSVFLESGQPLGKDRVYYLPRGMKIHVWNRYPDGGGDIYTLA